MAKSTKKKAKASKSASKPKAKAAGKAKPASKPTTHATAQAVSVLKFARETINKFFAGLDANPTAQVANVPNHALWTYGHLANTADWIRGAIDGKPASIKPEWDKLFGMGSKPVDDPRAYPSLAEVKKEYDRTFKELVALTESHNDTQLSAPCAKETGGFASSKLDAVIKSAWHEGWHLGQLTDLRRGLGLPGVF